MYWKVHQPRHFQVLYAEFEALIDIRTLDIIRGDLPRRACALVLEWAREHRAERNLDWDLCARNQQPIKIAPLA